MDELERLVNLYRTRDSSSARSKLDVLMDLERIRDPRVVCVKTIPTQWWMFQECRLPQAEVGARSRYAQTT